jgi:hypothetical protein
VTLPSEFWRIQLQEKELAVLLGCSPSCWRGLTAGEYNASMKLPRFTLRDLFWLTLVVGLVLALYIRERQTLDLVAERREVFDSMYFGWQWSFETLAEEHAQQTGVKVAGRPERVVLFNPDGTIARKDHGDNAWEFKQ